MNSSEDYSIDDLVADKSLFEKVVYTGPLEAVEILKKRWADLSLKDRVTAYLRCGMPEVFEDGFKATIFRHVATPNYEFRRFMCVPDALDLLPVFLEIHSDKFTLNNPLKYQLARLGFHMGFGKNGGSKIVYKRIIDFNESHKKLISEVKTLWGQSLIEFHHELFNDAFPGCENNLVDISKWLYASGATAKDYYRDVLALFVRNGILFENFMFDEEELVFIKAVFLPAFFEVWRTTGEKPLIVALEPTDVEGDIFWSCYPPDTLARVEQKEQVLSTVSLVH